MRLDTSQQMRTDMRMRMAPRMIQSMEILQMPLMALQERIDQELSENPVLVDLRETATPDPEAEPTALAEESTANDDGLDGLMEGWAEETFEGNRPSRSARAEESDRKQDAMLNMADRPRTLQDELLDQLGFLDCSPLVRELAEYMINNLDESGYLRMSLEEVVRDVGQGATLEQAEEALSYLQRLEPLGVGARSLQECLLLQLTPSMPMFDLLEKLIRDHLEDLRQNRLPLIERKTGYSLDEIKEGIEHLRRFDPRPGAQYHQDQNQYVVPDVIVEADDHGHYQARLADDYTPQLSISRQYQKMLRNRSADREAREFIQKRIQSARWLIESIEQRRSTLLKVASAIIEHQTEFLDKGPESIQPLKMQQIADQVGVHVTTVSRAVDDKWVLTPRGLYPLKRFFGGGTTTATGEEVAWDLIKQKLLDVIAKEDKSEPFSDEQLMDELGKQGLTVARRTVTKYRKALKIPSSRQRKQF